MCTYNMLMFSSISFGNSAMFLQLSFCISHLQSGAHFEFAVCPQRKNIRKNNDVETARDFKPRMLLQKQVLSFRISNHICLEQIQDKNTACSRQTNSKTRYLSSDRLRTRANLESWNNKCVQLICITCFRTWLFSFSCVYSIIGWRD